MLHKISEFCDKIDGLKKDADMLRDLKYNHPKTPERDHMIQGLIDQIQADCFIVSRDKQDYTKSES
tara:strand:- start:1108 stop:1305 length:198 start_codon:yes stop_codon:yes gene_type:complete